MYCIILYCFEVFHKIYQNHNKIISNQKPKNIIHCVKYTDQKGLLVRNQDFFLSDHLWHQVKRDT